MKYLFETTCLLIIAFFVNYFHQMKPENLFSHFSQQVYDYALPINQLSEDVFFDYHTYYRVMDSIDASKQTYFNFNTQEKIVLLQASKSLGIAIAQIESKGDQIFYNKFRLIYLNQLIDALPRIQINA